MHRLVNVFLLLLISVIHLTAQNQDFIWIMGTNPVNITDNNGLHWGATVVDFRNIQPEFVYDTEITLDMDGTNASISNSLGELQIYANGMIVNSRYHRGIPGADTTGHSNYWDLWTIEDFPIEGEDWLSGFPIVQGMLILPTPGKSNSFSLLYKLVEIVNEKLTISKLLSTEVVYDTTSEEYFGVENDKILFDDENLNIGQMQACRHANGRDWWLVQSNQVNDKLFVFLLDPQGLRLQKIFPNDPFTEGSISIGQSYYSPDGSKLLVAETIGAINLLFQVSVYDFDRVSGDLDLLFRDTLEQFRIHGAGMFSPNSQYLYVANHKNLYQYDLEESDIINSRMLIDTFDGYKFSYGENDPGTRTEFGPMALAPDGRIYSVPASSNRFLHAIHYPNERGVDCGFIQRDIMLPTKNRIGIPNFPNFRLGPMDGSIADTLGLDNRPTGRFRYEPDTSDWLNVRFTDLSFYRPETWTWDFGDGSSFNGQYPYTHTYTKEGVYEVCLTVSNENSSNTNCQTLYLGVTSVEEKDIELEFSLFPNPSSDVIHLNVKDYIPQDGRYLILDSDGRRIKRGSFHFGLNSVEISDLSSGAYIVLLEDRGRTLFSQQFLKVE